MAQIDISDNDLTALCDLVQSTDDAMLLRRAQALYWLCSGDAVSDIARRLCVSRATIYNWIFRFQQRAELDLPARFADAQRSGRPAVITGVIEPIIAQLVGTDPRDFGYHQTIWTADLLSLHLRKRHHVTASLPSVKRAIARLGVIWKRPRHQLGLRPKTGDKQKGAQTWPPEPLSDGHLDAG
jgi:transposase